MSPNFTARLRRYPPRALLAALAALTALPACRQAVEAPAEVVRPVRVVSIQKRATTDTVTLTGTVQAETEINLSFRIDGRLIERAVNVGDAVRPGQLVARLDSQNEETSLQAAVAQINAARAQLARGARQLRADAGSGQGERRFACGIRAVRSAHEDCRVPGRVGAGAGHSCAEPTELHAPRFRCRPASSRRRARRWAKSSAPDG